MQRSGSRAVEGRHSEPFFSGDRVGHGVQPRNTEALVFSPAPLKLTVGPWARPGLSLSLSFPSRAIVALSSNVFSLAVLSRASPGIPAGTRGQGAKEGSVPRRPSSPHPQAQGVLAEETRCIQIIKQKNWSD